MQELSMFCLINQDKQLNASAMSRAVTTTTNKTNENEEEKISWKNNQVFSKQQETLLQT